MYHGDIGTASDSDGYNGEDSNYAHVEAKTDVSEDDFAENIDTDTSNDEVPNENIYANNDQEDNNEHELGNNSEQEDPDYGG